MDSINTLQPSFNLHVVRCTIELHSFQCRSVYQERAEVRSREVSHRFGRVWPRMSPTPAAFPLRLTSIVQTSVFLFGLVGPPSEFDLSSSSAPTDRSSAAPAGKTPAVAEQSGQPAPTSSKHGGHRGGDVPSFAAIPGASATDETKTQ